MTQVLHVSAAHPLNNLDERLKTRIVEAQNSLFDEEFHTALELCDKAASDLRMQVSFPAGLRDEPATAVGDKTARELWDFFAEVLRQNQIPAQAMRTQFTSLAHRVHLLRAFRRGGTASMRLCR